MAKFELIAFDLDDTLVDTFSVAIPNCVAMVNKEYGVPIKESDWTKENGYRGKAGQGLLDAIEADYGTKLNLEEFLEMRKRYISELLHNGMPAAPGACAVLKTLQEQGRNIALCTNSVTERAHLSLKNAITDTGFDMFGVFGEHIYSAVPTMNAKPAPDVYINVAKIFQVEPHRALAIEDTPSGIQAAKAAGFTAVGYVGLHTDPDNAIGHLTRAGANSVIRHWDEFLPLLEKLEARQPAPAL